MTTPAATSPPPSPRRERIDRAVGAVVITGSVTSVAVTTWIAFRTPDALGYFLRDPLRLQEVHALWTGLMSANLLVLQVLYLARLPWLERAWGRTVLMRRHRRLGQWSFGLMVAHVALFALQRVLQDPRRPGAALSRVFLTDPWMLAATVGTLVVTVVVLTSVARARRWLRYESWHLIHLWAYVGIGLALPHQLISRDFAVGWTVTYWWALYLLATGAVLVFRVLVPVFRTLYHDIRVVAVRPESGAAVSITMTGRRLDRLGVRSGQFFIWRFLGSAGWSRGHPYSLSRAPTGDLLRVTVGHTGDGGRRASGLRIGSRVLIEGPYGAVVADHRRHDRLLMLAAGIGITPFRSLLESLPLRPGEATLLYRVHERATAVLLTELDELAGLRGVEVIVLAGARRSEQSWLPAGYPDDDVTALCRLVPDVAHRDVLICGPAGWMTAVCRASTAAGVADGDVHVEPFGW